jgi:hypothetical protein
VAGLITIDQLLARPGFEDLDSGQAEALIEDATALVRVEAEPMLDDVEAADTPPAVVAILVNMIRRGLDNPSGYAQETLGDYSRSTGSAAAATLYLTKREAKRVRRAAGKPSTGSLVATGDLPTQRSEESIAGAAGDFDGFFP